MIGENGAPPAQIGGALSFLRRGEGQYYHDTQTTDPRVGAAVGDVSLLFEGPNGGPWCSPEPVTPGHSAPRAYRPRIPGEPVAPASQLGELSATRAAWLTLLPSNIRADMHRWLSMQQEQGILRALHGRCSLVWENLCHFWIRIGAKAGRPPGQYYVVGHGPSRSRAMISSPEAPDVRHSRPRGGHDSSGNSSKTAAAWRGAALSFRVVALRGCPRPVWAGAGVSPESPATSASGLSDELPALEI